MKFKILIITSLLFIAIIVMNVKINTTESQNTQKENAPMHAFLNFEKNTVIKTEIISKMKKSISYPIILVQQEQENLVNTKPDAYSNSYQVFYKIEDVNQPTIDVLLEVDKQKNNASIEIRNITAKKEIDITNGKQPLYKNVPTDWVGNITIDNIKISNKICVILNTVSNHPQQICHTIEEVSHA